MNGKGNLLNTARYIAITLLIGLGGLLIGYGFKENIIFVIAGLVVAITGFVLQYGLVSAVSKRRKKSYENSTRGMSKAHFAVMMKELEEEGEHSDQE